MLASLEAKLAALGVLLVLLAGGALWMHHHGAQAQAAKDAATIAAKDTALRTASASLSAAAEALRAVNAQAKANAAAAAEQQGKAEAAARDAAASKVARAASEKAWQGKFDQLKQSTGCKAVLEQMLCPALSGY